MPLHRWHRPALSEVEGRPAGVLPVKPPPTPGWLQPLAASYLGLFSVRRVTGGGLRGYFFERREGRVRLGFFVGFLAGGRGRYRFLNPFPPECIMFAYVLPCPSMYHLRLVQEAGSLFRQSYTLALKYTATRPRFEFYEDQGAALVRHVPLASFPARLRSRYARNFFVETLALLVRTKLPEYLRTVKLADIDRKSLPPIA